MPEQHSPVPRHRGLIALAAIVAVVALLAGACGSSASTSTGAAAPNQGSSLGNLPDDDGTPTDGGSVSWGVEAETDSMSPSAGRWALSGHMLASAVFDPLVTIDADGNAVPYLAESITPNDDSTVWTITLPTGITFHDGEPLDAAAVAKNLQAGKTSIITGKAMVAVATIEAVTPTTVEITTTQPYATFPNLLLSQLGYIAAPRQIDDFHGGDYPIGTGPFVFKEWVKNDHFSATKNPTYWRAGLPHLDEIEFRPVPDSQQRLDELQDGTLDAIDTLAPDTIRAVREDTSLNSLEYTHGDEKFVTLNTTTAPFDDPIVRQALAYATDTAAYREQMGKDVYTEATGPYAPGQLGYLEDTGYPAFDLDRAKELVAEYTAKTGQPPTFAYTGIDTVEDARAQQLLASMWEAAGMHVSLESQKQEDQIINIVLGKYQAADFRNYSAPDPDSDYIWFSKNGVGREGDEIALNMPRYIDPTIDQALDSARTSTDPDTRDAQYQTVNRALAEGIPYLWLCRVDWMIAANPRVHGYAAAANGSIQSLSPKTWIADLWVD